MPRIFKVMMINDLVIEVDGLETEESYLSIDYRLVDYGIMDESELHQMFEKEPLRDGVALVMLTRDSQVVAHRPGDAVVECVIADESDPRWAQHVAMLLTEAGRENLEK